MRKIYPPQRPAVGLLVGICSMAILGLSNTSVYASSFLWENPQSSCLDSAAPLVEIETGNFPLDSSGGAQEIVLQKLPVSVDRPELITEARLALVVGSSVKSALNPQLSAEFTFPDPKPFGLPFSFQALSLEWTSPQDHSAQRLVLDWADECSGIGFSLFPGQGRSEPIPFNDFGTDQGGWVPGFKVKLWGSRN